MTLIRNFILRTITEMGSVIVIMILLVMHGGDSDGPGDVDLCDGSSLGWLEANFDPGTPGPAP